MGKQFGTAGRSMFIKISQFLWILVVITASCSGTAPKLNQSYLPLNYVKSSISWGIQIKNESNLNVAPINLDKKRNQQLEEHWRRGYFDSIFKKRHPVVNVKGSDISNLDVYLNDVLTIYYVQVAFSKGQTNESLRQFVAKHIKCEPLSNLEIRFLMNADSLSPFSQIPLSMLMISAHELMLQIGAVPEYPKVISPYLRKRYGLSALKNLEDGNIFAVKRRSEPTPNRQSGFVVCRREH